MVCLFSRSGSVMVEVLNKIQFQKERLGLELDIFTNNTKTWDRSVDQFASFLTIIPHEEIERKLMKMEPTVVLLFGYLRILSPQVCVRHEIYNLHPGDILHYPELKGKDPIEKYFNNLGNHGPVKEEGYKLGCVIHKVTPEVDEGPILSHYIYTASDYEDAIDKSRETAIKMWISFLNNLT